MRGVTYDIIKDSQSQLGIEGVICFQPCGESVPRDLQGPRETEQGFELLTTLILTKFNGSRQAAIQAELLGYGASNM